VHFFDVGRLSGKDLYTAAETRVTLPNQYCFANMASG